KKLSSEIQDEKLAFIYVEILPYEFQLFIKRCINSLFFGYLKTRQLVSARENLNTLVQMAKEPLPQTATLVENLLTHIEKEKPENLFKDLFAAIETFSLETKKNCILIFDEFQNIKEFGTKNIWNELGKKLMFQKNSLFIFSSSAKIDAKEILSNELSLLFGNFETIELNPLKSIESTELINQCMGNIHAEKEITSFLINFTGGNPFYLKTICENARLECSKEFTHTLNKSVLVKVLEDLLFNEWGIFNLKFNMALSQVTSNRSKNEYCYILSGIAAGKNRLKDLASHLRRPKEELNQKLKKLSDQGMINKNGAFYSICDRLMNFWLKFVVYEKLSSLSNEYSEQAIHFRKMIEEEIDEFIQISQKDIADRMIDLFNDFEGDDVQIERKKLQLSTFKELKIVHFENPDLRVGIFAKAQDSIWLAAVKEEGLNEHDVNEFIQSAKRYKHKTINKLILCLGDIERNARLLAKESHILTWDIASINNLMDIYGKPRIVK
ncbi:MAG TPA: hypothetical protein PLU24_02850, partial [Candidatus Omnitrophota bacterium]|nr:hypothetical protein [Candidatus Omnitrophota bacterium]